MQKNKVAGFTLIEVMLVIAIAALMASLGVMVFRHQSQESKANQLALEMEHVLEGAMAYYDVNNQWPVQNDRAFEQAFLPNGTANSSIGQPILYNAIGAQRFYAALAVPSELGNLVKAKLANAVLVQRAEDPDSGACSSDAAVCYVHAEIPKPGLSSENKGVISVRDVGIRRDNTDITFECGEHQTGRLVVMPFEIYAGNHGNNKNSFAINRFYTESSDSNENPYSCNEDSPTQWRCQLNLGGNTKTGDGTPPDMAVEGGHIYIQYLALCVNQS